MKLRIFAIAAAVILACATLVGSTANAVDGECPPALSGHWLGGGHSDVFNVDVPIDGQIDVTNNVVSGPFTEGNTPGMFNGLADCDTVTGTFDGNALGPINFTGTYSPDGQTLAGDYTFDAAEDHGTWSISIDSAPQEVAVGDVSVFEGGANQPAAFADAKAKPPSTRTVEVPITLTEPHTKKLTVHYRVIGSANDIVDNGQVHAIAFGARQTSKSVEVKVIANGTPQADRSVQIQIIDINGGYRIYNRTGTVTIVDDDGS